MTSAATTSKTQPFRVHMPPDLYALVQRRAKEQSEREGRKISMSQWIKDAIYARLEREGWAR